MLFNGQYVGVRACSGGAMPGAKALMSWTLARFPEMGNGGIYNCRQIAGSSALSLHAGGRACDIMTGTGIPTLHSKWLAEQFRVFSAELGLQGIIHDNRDWFCNVGPDWTSYGGSNPHDNHNHVAKVSPSL